MTPTILLVEDSPSDAGLVRAALAADVGDDVIWVETLADALIELDARVIDCVVLALGLSDGGIELIDALLTGHPNVPIVVISGRDDAALAVEAVRQGAQDCLLKSELGSRTMGRAVRYAIERACRRSVRARSEAHYRSVIDSLGEGVVVLNASGEVETANAEAARILGLSVDELFAPAPTELRWCGVDERDRPLPVESYPAMVALRTGEPVVDFTMGVHPPAGSLRWLEVNAFPMKTAPDTPPYAVVVSMRDVTEKHAAIKRTQFQADLLDAVGQAVMATDAFGTISYWNHAAEQQCGWPAHEALGRNLIELTSSPEMAERMEPILTELIAGRSWTGDLDVLRRDGTWFPALVTDTPYFDDEGRLAGVIAVATDITERERAEETMRQLSAIVESSGDAIMGETLDGVITSWNRGAETLYGYRVDEVVGHHVSMLIPDVPADELADVLRRVAVGETVEHLDTTGRRKDGVIVDTSVAVSPVYGKDGAVVGCSAIVRDVTARAEAQRALKHQALHDTLTGLPNRMLLDDRINQALARARRHDELVAVLLLDLDEFKLVNDGLGHFAGDELLIAVARRLAGCVRPDDTVARFGGDEFVIVTEVADAEVAAQVGTRVLNALQTPFAVQGMDIFVTTSIGLVVADGDADSDGLLRDADAAMYRAKERGRSRMVVFDDELRDRAAAKLQSTTALRRALERGELRLFFQPVVALDDCRPLAVEALLRWQHPERGLVSPAEFIPLAEDTGMIVPIGRWVLQEALRQRARWEAELPHHPALRLSVNLSARQLSEPKLLDDIATALSAHETDPGSLILEVTESVVMGGLDSLSTLNAIHDLGVALHVDDFGTGYSSLAYLKTLPVDALKIDRAFVDGLGTDADDLAIVTAVIALARALSLDVVAEGVETEAQRRVLRDLHCEHAQGYLFARPMPYDELVAWLTNHPRV